MNKYEYFCLAIAKERYLERHWLIRAFAIIGPTPEGEHQTVGDFWTDVDGKAFTMTEAGAPEEITDYQAGEPLFPVKGLRKFKKGDIPALSADTESHYSTVLTNQFLYYSFQGAIPYYEGRFNGKLLDRWISTGMKNGTITVEQNLTWSKCASMMEVLCNTSVPSATIKGMMPVPGIRKLRDKLVSEAGDSINDPVVLSEVENQLIEYAKKHLEGDKITEFRLKDKAYSVSMKRVHMSFGGEPRPDGSGEYDVSTRSLVEGWDYKQLPMYANSLRMGSLYRGSLTALGGEAAEFSARVGANTEISEEFCGTKVLAPFKFLSWTHSRYIGRYVLDGGKPTQLKAGDTEKLIGQVVQIFSPITCKTPNGNVCEVCMGDNVARAKIGLGIQTSNPGQALLRSFLSMMHGNKLETQEYSLESLT